MRLLMAGVLAALCAVAVPAGAARPGIEAMTLMDHQRGREVPVQLHFPAERHACVSGKSCPVVLFSPGYGVPHTGYAFLTGALADEEHLVVAVQHDLPSDPPLTGKGNLVAVRTPAWQIGAANLRFVREALSRSHPDYDWSRLTLIGHSNGGDIASLLLRDTPAFADALITLDHRRVPLPRDASLRVMSIRGSDFEADPGVLPTGSESAAGRICIVEIPGSRHNDMLDDGPPQLKSEINALVCRFMRSGDCGA